MIRVDVNETFPIGVQLVDEVAGTAATGKTVYYDIRQQPGDVPLTPTLSGILPESTTEPGIYSTLISIDEAGSYINYATCAEFVSNSEEIVVNAENIYHVVKSTHQYNISVEDVVRENAAANASQIVRNVPLNATDYIINRVKPDGATDWSTTTISGNVWAWYRSTSDSLPYKMGPEF